MRSLARQEGLLRKTLSLFLAFALCAQPALGQKAGQASANPGSQYPDFKKPLPHKDKNGKDVPDSWDITICKGSDFVFPIGGPEVSVSKFTATEPYPSGDATAQGNGNSIVISGRHASPGSNGFSILEANVTPTDGSPLHHIKFYVSVIDCNPPKTVAPPPKTNTVIGNSGTPTSKAGQKPAVGGAAPPPNTGVTAGTPAAPGPTSPNPTNPAGNPQGTNPAGANSAGGQPANTGANAAGGGNAAGGASTAGGQTANPAGQAGAGGGAPCPNCNEGQLLRDYQDAQQKVSDLEQTINNGAETVNAAQDALSVAGNALSIAKGTPGEAAAQAAFNAAEAQFKAAQDAVQQAKNELPGAQEAAAKAEKAYDDCVQQRKNCPPPANPSGVTGQSGIGGNSSVTGAGNGAGTGNGTGTGSTTGTSTGAGGASGTGTGTGGANDGGAGGSTTGGVFNPVSAGGSTNAVSTSPAVYVYQLVITGGSVNEPNTPGVVTAGGTPNNNPPANPGGNNSGGNNNGGAGNNASGNNNGTGSNNGNNNGSGNNNGNGAGNDGGGGGGPAPQKQKGQLTGLPLVGRDGDPRANNGAGANKNAAGNANGIATNTGGASNNTPGANAGTSPAAQGTNAANGAASGTNANGGNAPGPAVGNGPATAAQNTNTPVTQTPCATDCDEAKLDAELTAAEEAVSSARDALTAADANLKSADAAMAAAGTALQGAAPGSASYAALQAQAQAAKQADEAAVTAQKAAYDALNAAIDKVTQAQQALEECRNKKAQSNCPSANAGGVSSSNGIAVSGAGANTATTQPANAPAAGGAAVPGNQPAGANVTANGTNAGAGNAPSSSLTTAPAKPGAITVGGVTYNPIDPVQLATDLALQNYLADLAKRVSGPWVDKNGNPVSPSTIQAGLLVREAVLKQLAAMRFQANSLKNLTLQQKIALLARLQNLANAVMPKYQAYKALEPAQGLRDTFLKFQAQVADYEQQIKEGVAVKVEEHPFQATTRTPYPASEQASRLDYLKGEVARLKGLLAQSPYQQFLNARNAYYQALSADPLLAIQGLTPSANVAGTVQMEANGPHLFEQLLHGTPEDKLNALDQAITQYPEQLTQQIDRLSQPPTPDLLIEMGSPQYAQSAALAAASGGDFTKKLVDGLQAEYQGVKGVEAYGKAFNDFLMAVGSAIPIAGIPVMLAQVYTDGKDYIVAVSDEKNAKALAPLEGYQPVGSAADIRQDASGKLVTSAVSAGVAIGVQAVGKALEAGKSVRVVYNFGGKAGSLAMDAKSAGTVAAVAGDAKGAAVVADANAAGATADTEAATKVASGNAGKVGGGNGLASPAAAKVANAQQQAAEAALTAKIDNAVKAGVITPEEGKSLFSNAVATDSFEQADFSLTEKMFAQQHPGASIISDENQLYTLGQVKQKAALEAAGKPQVWSKSEAAMLQKLSKDQGWINSWEKLGLDDPDPGFRPAGNADDARNVDIAAGKNLNVVDDSVMYGSNGPLGNGGAPQGAPATGASVAPDNGATQAGGIKPTGTSVAPDNGATQVTGGKTPVAPNNPQNGTPPTVIIPPGSDTAPTVNIPHGAETAPTVKVSPPGSNASTVKLGTPDIPPASNTPTVKLGTPDIPPATNTPTVKLGTPDIPPATNTQTVKLGNPDLPPAVSTGTGTASWEAAKAQSPQLQTFDQLVTSGQNVPQQQLRDVVMGLKADPAAMRSLKNAPPNVRQAFNQIEASIYGAHDQAVISHIEGIKTLPDGRPAPWAGKKIKVDDFRTPGANGQVDPLSINTDRDYRVLYQNDKGQWIEVPRKYWQDFSTEQFAQASGYTPEKLRQIASPSDIKSWENWNPAEHNGETLDQAMKDKWQELHQQLATDKYHPEASVDFSDQARIQGELSQVGQSIKDVKQGQAVLQDAERLGMMYNEKADAYLRLDSAMNPAGNKLEAAAQLNKGIGMLDDVRNGYQQLYGGFGQQAPIGRLSPRFQKAAEAVKSLAPFDKTVTPQQITQVEKQLRELGFGKVTNPGNPLKDFKEALDSQFQSLKTVPGPIGPMPAPATPTKPTGAPMGGGMVPPSDGQTPPMGPPQRTWSRRTPTGWASFSSGSFASAEFSSSELFPGTIVRLVAKEASAEPAGGEVSFSIVANGKSSGQAFELQVIDPTGKIKQVAMPEGVVLEPLRVVPANAPNLRPVGNMITKQLNAYCLEYAKQPPQPGMLYRIAPQAVQDKFKPIRSVLSAGRQLAANGSFHPDSDPASYADDIRQYALWSKLENWGEQKFTQMFLEHTKKNAQAMNVKWTKQMEQAVLGLAPGRWADISMVLEEAQKLLSSGGERGAP